MNKNRYFVLAFLVLLFCASCTKEQEKTAANGPIIEAVIAESDAKTALVDGGTQVYWEVAEELSVFYNDANLHFVSLNKQQAQSALFACTRNVVIAVGEGEESSSLIGLYPYSEDAVCDGNSITSSLPFKQTGKAGSFGKGCNIAMAKGKSTSLAFYNLMGGLRFTLSQSGVKTITLEGNNGEALAGTFTADFDGERPAVSSVVEAKDKIVLNAPEGSAFETGKWYYIVALPGTLSGGFKMHFETDDKFADLVSTKSRTFERGKFGSVQNIDSGLEFKDLATKSDWTVSGDGQVSRIVDDDMDTYWIAPSSTLPVSLTVDMKIVRNIDRFYFNQAWNHQNGTCFSKYKLEYSTDNTNWKTAIAQREAGTTDPYSQGIMFDGNALVSARYFRITFTEAAESGKPVQLAEINFGNSNYTSGTALQWMPSLKNSLTPFEYEGSDPTGNNRWFQMKYWKYENCYGMHFDTVYKLTPNGTPVLFSWQSNFTNAKLYQTLNLLPGVYAFGIAAKQCDYLAYITPYIVASKGDKLSDFSTISSASPYSDPNYLNALLLDAGSLPTGTEDHHWNWCYFTLSEQSDVSMGFCYAINIPVDAYYTQYYRVGANCAYASFIK